MSPDSSERPRSVAAILNNIFFLFVGIAVAIAAIVIAVVKM